MSDTAEHITPRQLLADFVRHVRDNAEANKSVSTRVPYATVPLGDGSFWTRGLSVLRAQGEDDMLMALVESIQYGLMGASYTPDREAIFYMERQPNSLWKLLLKIVPEANVTADPLPGVAHRTLAGPAPQ